MCNVLCDLQPEPSLPWTNTATHVRCLGLCNQFLTPFTILCLDPSKEKKNASLGQAWVVTHPMALFSHLCGQFPGDFYISQGWQEVRLCEKLLPKMKLWIGISLNVYTATPHSRRVQEISLGLKRPIHFAMLVGYF